MTERIRLHASWAALLLTLGCGSRTSDLTGGETSFLSCNTDEECVSLGGKCVDRRCRTPSPPMDSISSEGNTHSSATSDATDLVTWSAPRLDAGAGVEADTGGFAYERRVIDDMEEDIVGSEAGFFWWGAIGNWFKTIDGKLSDAPRATLETPREGSHRATWIRGSANTAVLWAQLDHPQTRRLDLSEYVGFSFWARSGLPEAGLAVGLNLSDPAADGPQPSLPLSVSTEWRRFDVTFDELMSVTDVATIDFVMDVGAGDFDFWIDDLALLCAGPCPG